MSQENLNTNSEHTPEVAVEAPKPKKRLFLVVPLTVLCTIGGFLLLAALFEILYVISGVLILSIAVMVWFGAKGITQRGTTLALILIIALSCFIVDDMASYQVPRARNYTASRVVCGTRLKSLWMAIDVYTNDHDGMLPAADWCDRLVEEDDVTPKFFQCPGSHSIEGESDYCLNQYAAGRKLSELPPNMVLLFEMEVNHPKNELRLPIQQRPSFANLPMMRDIFTGREKVYLNQWNQVGGPDVLDVNRHPAGGNILFADGKTAFMNISEYPQLRWDIEGKVFYQPRTSLEPQREFISSNKTISLAFIGLLWIVCSIYILIRFHAGRYWKFALFLGILAAAAGMYYGNMSGEAYFIDCSEGRIPGLITGLLAGVCFAVIFAGRSSELKQSITFKWFMMGVGMITGILCSTFVHIALMIVNEETNPFGIIIGIPYGIFVGAVLGLISYFIIRKFYVR